MDEWADRLRRLEERLERIEAVLGMKPPTDPTGQSTLPTVERLSADPEGGPAAAPADADVSPPSSSAVPPPLPRSSEKPLVVHHEQRSTVPPALVKPMPTASTPVEPPPSTNVTLQAKGALEQMIGIRWTGWVGAVVLVIGMILFVKLAYDNGWFPRVSPAGRVAAIAIFGLGLLVAGEAVYRRASKVSASAIWGAGLALLFVAVYVGFAHYRLFDALPALVGLVLTTLIGAALAMRSRLAATAALALVGAYLAPFILWGANRSLSWEYPYVYALILQCVALFLANWGLTARWAALRWLALIGTIVCLVDLVNQEYFGRLLVFGVLFHLEILLFAWRTRNDPAYNGRSSVVLSVGVTLIMAVLTVAWMHDEPPTWRAGSLLLLAAFCQAQAILIHRWQAHRELVWSLCGQAVALVIVHVPFTYDGVTVPIVWAGLAVGFAVLGGRYRWIIPAAGAAATWVAAVIVTAVHSGQGWLNSEWPVGNEVIHGWTIIFWGLAVVAQVLAWFLRPLDEPGRRVKAVAGLCGFLLAGSSILWGLASFHALSPVMSTLAIVVWAWLLALSQPIARRNNGAFQAAIVLLVAALKWVVVDLMTERLGTGWTRESLAYGPILNPLMGVGGLIVVSAIALYFARRRAWANYFAGQSGDYAYGLVTALMMLVSIGLSLEIDRVIERAQLVGWTSVWQPGQVKQFGWTALWAVSLSVQSIILSRRGMAGLHLALLMALAAKFIAVDLFATRWNAGVIDVPIARNVLVVLGLIVLAGLGVVWKLADRQKWQLTTNQVRVVAELLMLAVVLSLGSIEVERWFARQHGFRFGRQVGFSIWWGVVAIASIAAGFIGNRPVLRYAGLAVLGITLLKVVLVDMHDSGTGWRVASFVGLGLVLLVTSVVYGKLSQSEKKPWESLP